MRTRQSQRASDRREGSHTGRVNQAMTLQPRKVSYRRKGQKSTKPWATQKGGHCWFPLPMQEFGKSISSEEDGSTLHILSLTFKGGCGCWKVASEELDWQLSVLALSSHCSARQKKTRPEDSVEQQAKATSGPSLQYDFPSRLSLPSQSISSHFQTNTSSVGMHSSCYFHGAAAVLSAQLMAHRSPHPQRSRSFFKPTFGPPSPGYSGETQPAGGGKELGQEGGCL